MGRRRWFSGLALVSAVIVVSACTSDAYPLLTPAGAGEWAPTTIGKPVQGVVLYLQPRPGDRIDLISATPIGTLSGADVTLYFSPQVPMADGGWTIGEKLEPIPGASVSIDPGASPGPRNDFGIVAEVTPRASGTYTITNLEVHLRINGGPEQVKTGISQDFTICAADPAPATCEASSEP
jgi:hypothetical protein